MLFGVMMLLSYVVAFGLYYLYLRWRWVKVSKVITGVYVPSNEQKPSPQPESYPRFPKGTIIVCPKCDKHIATAKRDIYGSEAVQSEPWEGIPAHDDMRCPECWTRYAKIHGGLRVYTPEGWL